MTADRTRRRSGLVLSVVGLAVAATPFGCATTKGTTWDDDAKEGISTPTRRFSERGHPHPAALSKDGAISKDGATGGLTPDELSFELRRTLDDARALALSPSAAQTTPQAAPQPSPAPQASPTSGAATWSPTVVDLWVELIHKLSSALADESAPAPAVILQARVGLEIALEDIENIHGMAPDEVRERTSTFFQLLSEKMHARRREASRDPHLRPRRHEVEVVLDWPVTPLIVTSRFGYRVDPIIEKPTRRFHSGIDLGGGRGTLVSAAGPGRVISASWRGGHGRSVSVLHPGGITTVYSHLRSIFVSEGDEVDPGSPIGLMGSTGRSTGPHLHFEVRKNGAAINPMEAIGRTMLSSL